LLETFILEITTAGQTSKGQVFFNESRNT